MDLIKKYLKSGVMENDMHPKVRHFWVHITLSGGAFYSAVFAQLPIDKFLILLYNILRNNNERKRGTVW